MFESYQADTAIIEIGTVTNRGGSADTAANDIVVNFDITILDDTSVVDGEVYWVSVGVEHYQASRLWVAQFGLTVSRVAEVSYCGKVEKNEQACIVDFILNILENVVKKSYPHLPHTKITSAGS